MIDRYVCFINVVTSYGGILRATQHLPLYYESMCVCVCVCVCVFVCVCVLG